MFGQFSTLHFKGLKYDLYFFNNSVFLCGKIWTNDLNSLSANPTKWSNTQTTRRLLPTNCLSVFDHFVGLAVKGLIVINGYL